MKIWKLWWIKYYGWWRNSNSTRRKPCKYGNRIRWWSEWWCKWRRTYWGWLKRDEICIRNCGRLIKWIYKTTSDKESNEMSDHSVDRIIYDLKGLNYEAEQIIDEIKYMSMKG